MEEISLTIRNINKSYNEKVVFKNFEINLYKNKVNCILGKSGCGKSTLLNLLSKIIKNDTELYSEIEDMQISYIFQEDRLIDWITIEDNINLVLKKNYKKSDRESICKKYLKEVGIYEYRQYYPQMLSGGTRQRANIVRAFVYPSQIIIMDEPFKSIDISSKKQIMNIFKTIIQKEKRTVIFVTHDIEEAIYLSDNINILGGTPTVLKKNFNNKEKFNKELIENSI